MKAVLGALVLTLAAGAALGQESPSPAPEEARAPLTPRFSAEIRERYDNPELPLFDNEDSNVDPLHAALPFFWSRIRLGAHFDPLPRFSAFVEVQDSRYWGQEGGTTRSAIKGLDLHQGWLQLGDAERYARFGRQEYSLGEERLFGRDDWYETGRAFDMIRFRSLLGGGRVFGEVLYAETTNPVPDNEDEAFELVALTRLLPHGGFLRAYAVEKHDSHRGPKTGRKLTIGTVGLHGHGRIGDWELDLEAAGQGGHNYDDNQRAVFVAGAVRRHVPGPHPLALGLELSWGSGDGDDEDGVSHNLDVLYPARHDKYGLLDLLSLVNNRHWGLVLDVAGQRPGDRFHVAVRHLAVDNPKGKWVNARGETIGRDPLGLSGRSIGWELDISLARKVFATIDLTVTLEGGYLRGGEFARAVDNIVQAYEGVLTLTYRFGRAPE